MGAVMVSTPTSNFVKQQGFPDVSENACGAHYSALSFQPRVLAPIILVGIVLQSGPLFLVLSAVQWWNALLPRWNAFDHVYNGLFARRPGVAPLTPAPAPRRFSMGMAATFMLGIGLSLMTGRTTLAIVLQVFLVVALSAILFGKLCLGSYIYHLLRGQASFANRTLPWSQS
jgi:hypothetical protein